MAALVETSLPTGADAFSADEATARGGLLADLGLAGSLSLSANAVLGTTLDSGSESLALTLTPSVALGGRTSVYGGWAGFLGEGSDAHYVEAGLAALIDDDTQIDLNTGAELGGDDVFVGLGLARRLHR